MTIDNIVYFGERRGYKLLLEKREEEFPELEIKLEKCTDLSSAVHYLDSLLESDGLDSPSGLKGTIFVLNSLLKKGIYPKKEFEQKFGKNPYAPAMVLVDHFVEKRIPRNKVLILSEAPKTEESKVADKYFEERGFKNLLRYHTSGLIKVWEQIEELLKQE